MGQSATDMIRTDHRKVEELYQRYQAMNGQANDKRALAEHICRELELHAAVEEGVFYPAVRTKLGEEGVELVEEALHEHGEMKELIGKFRGGELTDTQCDQCVHELMQTVQHHVEEEESEMLPQAEQHMGDELDRLGERMQQRKQEAAPSMEAMEQHATA